MQFVEVRFGVMGFIVIYKYRPDSALATPKWIAGPPSTFLGGEKNQMSSPQHVDANAPPRFGGETMLKKLVCREEGEFSVVPVAAYCVRKGDILLSNAAFASTRRGPNPFFKVQAVVQTPCHNGRDSVVLFRPHEDSKVASMVVSLWQSVRIFDSTVGRHTWRQAAHLAADPRMPEWVARIGNLCGDVLYSFIGDGSPSFATHGSEDIELLALGHCDERLHGQAVFDPFWGTDDARKSLQSLEGWDFGIVAWQRS